MLGDREIGKSTDVPVQLFAWLSPTFPVSGFAYSQGLETAVEQGWVNDPTTLKNWLAAMTCHGGLRNDLVLLALAHGARNDREIADIRALSAAFQPTAERASEALTQGESFRLAYLAGWLPDPSSKWAQDNAPLSIAVAVGLAARDHDIALVTTLEAFAVAFHGNLISAAIRLGVLGQFDGQRVQASLMPDVKSACHLALGASEEDLGSASYGADLASMLHETQTTRIFRT